MKKEEAITLKEWLARYEFTAEGRHYIGKQAQENLETKYRYSGAKYNGHSMSEFKKTRTKQIEALYDAYTEIARGRGYNRLMGPRDIQDTSEEALRRVTGPNGTYNTGLIALDSIDINIISAIAVEYETKRIPGYLSTYDVENIVNNVGALHSLSQKALNQEISIHTMLRETDVLKTELAKENYNYRLETYEEYAHYHPPAKGIINKFVNSIRKALDPEKVAEEEKRFDNTKVQRSICS